MKEHRMMEDGMKDKEQHAAARTWGGSQPGDPIAPCPDPALHPSPDVWLPQS